jgi:hypothetical protein
MLPPFASLKQIFFAPKSRPTLRMADLSWGPFDCASERVGPLPANAGGARSATFSASVRSTCGDDSDGELDVEPGRWALETPTLLSFALGVLSTLPGSRRASAPAPAPPGIDRRFTGAVLARRFTTALFVASSGMMGSAGAAPAASSHLYQVGTRAGSAPQAVRRQAEDGTDEEAL